VTRPWGRAPKSIIIIVVVVSPDEGDARAGSRDDEGRGGMRRVDVRTRGCVRYTCKGIRV